MELNEGHIRALVMMTIKPNRRLWLVVLSVTLLSTMALGKAAEDGGVRLNLTDADITALINTVAEVTGRRFVVDPRVRAKVTVISPRPMAADELYEVFLSVLQVHGFAAVPSGPVTKIVPELIAKQLGTDASAANVGNDRIVTRVIPVEHVPVAQLVPILRPLIPQTGHFGAYPPTNMLIISDRAANVERLSRIVERIDRAGGDELEVIRLQHASATELVRVLQSLQETDETGLAPVRLAADARSNSILMSGDEAARLRLRTIIAHLDTPLAHGGDTRVIYLRYSKAEEVAKVLQGIVKSLPEGDTTKLAAKGDSAIGIQAHKATNSLLISAPPKVQAELEGVIRQLDVRRAQVLIEAAIAEVSMDQAAELGMQWAVDATGSGIATGGTSFSAGSGSSLAGIIGSLSQQQLPDIGDGLSLAIGDLAGGLQFATLVRALASDTDTNILSTPTLVTLDNEKAQITVAQNVPFITGQFTTNVSAGGQLNPFQTVQRKDVGLILTVTPHINEGNSVMLEIRQEVSNISSDAQAVDLITNKRVIETTVMADTGKLIVLGGLIDEQVSEVEQRIPLLGSIPIIGELFRYRTSSNQKTNLMVFLRPHIIREGEAMAGYANSKYSYIRAAQLAQRADGIGLLPNAKAPLLPPLKRPVLPPPFQPDG
ncbi:MAG: type II secretion system secretin GspD [Nitrococcus sp.]|nr:type II secretion system secretin GspD [Nitrococcus sp.]